MYDIIRYIMYDIIRYIMYDIVRYIMYDIVRYIMCYTVSYHPSLPLCLPAGSISKTRIKVCVS